ncbi:MAG: GNAT family N-acetyltransferase [Trueperaceae bacterium]|nr:MAG: GNAT family N-acetyltransferase [Trueperaceae bacterium]
MADKQRCQPTGCALGRSTLLVSCSKRSGYARDYERRTTPKRPSSCGAIRNGHALARWGFEQLQLEEINVVVIPENEASPAVARRLALPDHGTTEAYYGLPLRHFVLTREEWTCRTEPVNRR